MPLRHQIQSTVIATHLAPIIISTTLTLPLAHPPTPMTFDHATQFPLTSARTHGADNVPTVRTSEESLVCIDTIREDLLQLLHPLSCFIAEGSLRIGDRTDHGGNEGRSIPATETGTVGAVR